MKVSIIILTLFIAIHKNSADMTMNFENGAIENKNCPLFDDPEHIIHLPHPDCSKFYKCSNGLAYPMNCPTGQHWSVKLDRCDWPGVAECEPNDKTSTTTTTTATTTTTTADTTIPTTTTDEPTDKTTDDGVKPNNVCKNIDISTLLPHPTDCTKFIQCDNGRGHIKSCPAGLHFSVSDNRCQYPDKANCQVAK